MSKVHHKGTLILEPPLSKSETLAQQMRRILLEEGVHIDESTPGFDLDTEFSEALFCRFIVHDGSVYRVKMEQVSPHGDIYSAKQNTDGSIDFELRYSTCFESAIGTALNAMKKQR